jgi:hypothetical protein
MCPKAHSVPEIILPEDVPGRSKHVGDFTNKDNIYYGALVGVYYFV